MVEGCSTYTKIRFLHTAVSIFESGPNKESLTGRINNYYAASFKNYYVIFRPLGPPSVHFTRE